ncbi:MAG: hypothetical protein K0Q51_162 [Rickettsiaceae bacterium]|jgi:hypothetical protein|nr:hypothetical protein [Rickettsiaceae bacterium]
MLGRYEKTLIEYIKCLKILSDNGVYFISRYKADTNIYDLGGQQLDLLKILEKASS